GLCRAVLGWGISRDGDRLAILRSPASPVEIYTLHGHLLSKIPSHSLAKLISLAWSADQRGLFLTRKAEGGGTELLYTDLRGNTKSLPRCIRDNSCFGLPSPDGRHLAIVDRSQSTNMWMMENFCADSLTSSSDAFLRTNHLPNLSFHPRTIRRPLCDSR